jgi:hypothetical protein
VLKRAWYRKRSRGEELELHLYPPVVRLWKRVTGSGSGQSIAGRQHMPRAVNKINQRLHGCFVRMQSKGVASSRHVPTVWHVGTLARREGAETHGPWRFWWAQGWWAGGLVVGMDPASCELGAASCARPTRHWPMQPTTGRHMGDGVFRPFRQRPMSMSQCRSSPSTQPPSQSAGPLARRRLSAAQ